MERPKHIFTDRQYMVSPCFEVYHYYNEPMLEVEYHNHDFYEIFFFISGNVTYVIEGKNYKLRPNDIIIINNREFHKPIIREGGEYERVVIWVAPEYAEKRGADGTDLSMCFNATSEKKYNLLRPGREIQNYIIKIINRLERACDSTGFGGGILRETYMTELLVYLNRAYLHTFDEDIETDVVYNEKIDSVIRHINNNLEGDLSLESLAERFYISKYHLVREFKKYTGYTLHDYVRKKRLILARILLKSGSSVSEACMQCGFGDYSNFIRSFRKAFGASPKKYSLYKEV